MSIVGRVRDVSLFCRFRLDVCLASGSLQALGAATIAGNFIPALSAHGILDEPGNDADKVGVQHAVGKPGASGDFLARSKTGQHVHLPGRELDIVNAFDVVFALEGFQAAVKDGLVQVGPVLNETHPDALSSYRMNDIEHQALVGTEVLESKR